MTRRTRQRVEDTQQRERPRRVVSAHGTVKAGEPDWSQPCLNCGAKPIVPETGLCGPCTFGEAETSGGNW